LRLSAAVTLFAQPANRFAVDRLRFARDKASAVRISRGLHTRAALIRLNELVQMG
jgi:hypothetical protein